MSKLRWAWVLCALVLAAPAAAAGNFYVGASVGSSSLDLPEAQGSLNLDATGYKGYVGYRIFRYLSAELAYTDFGDPSETINGIQFESEARTAALWAIGILPVSPRLELYGRIGAASYDTSLKIDGVSPPNSDADGTELAWGFGISYNVTRKLGIVLEWENYDLDNTDVTFTSLGLRYSF